MPRYFLTLRDAYGEPLDTFDREFEDDTAALEFVRDVAALLALSPIQPSTLSGDCRLQVTSGEGLCVHEQPLARPNPPVPGGCLS